MFSIFKFKFFGYFYWHLPKFLIHLTNIYDFSTILSTILLILKILIHLCWWVHIRCSIWFATFTVIIIIIITIATIIIIIIIVIIITIWWFVAFYAWILCFGWCQKSKNKHNQAQQKFEVKFHFWHNTFWKFHKLNILLATPKMDLKVPK